MAEFDDKLNSILSNPDAMSQIMQLAQSLGGGGAQESAPPPPPDPPHRRIRLRLPVPPPMFPRRKRRLSRVSKNGPNTPRSSWLGTAYGSIFPMYP